MKRLPIPALVVLLFVILSWGFLGSGDQKAEETIAAAEGGAKSQAIPASHQAFLDALHTTRDLNYTKQSLDAAIGDLSRTLGITIHLHNSVRQIIFPTRTIDIRTEEPISHRTAIRLVLQQFGVADYRMVFDESQLTLVRGEDYAGPDLRTYSLAGRSNFSVAERQRWIESTRAEVHANTWSLANKTWIQPGESIYEIDVYQDQKVHKAIANRMSKTYRANSVDKDIQALSVFAFGLQESPGKSLDTKAAVERLRKKYAYEPIGDRLSYEAPKKQAEPPSLTPAARKRMQLANERFENAKTSKHSFSELRSRSLQMLHEEEAAAFINRPGAGLSRMPGPGPSYLPEPLPQDLPLASREMIRTSEDVPVSLPATKTAASSRRVFLPSAESLLEFHQSGEDAFLTPQSFGFIKNRKQVAGFQSHAFSYAPQLQSHLARPWYRQEKEVWAIHRLELVSLLKHEKPAVYVSRNLPRMEKLKSAPARPLNPFEASALSQLREGEDLITHGSLNRIEMLGALRATKQCQQCHDVPSGALLGAFSYELLRDPQIDPQKFRKKNGNQPVL